MLTRRSILDLCLGEPGEHKVIAFCETDLPGSERFIFFEREHGFADRFIRMRRAVQAGVKLRAPVYVYWPVNDYCNGHFLSFFEEIENVSFVDETTASRLRNHPLKVDGALVDENSVRWPSAEEQFIALKLKEQFIQRVREFVVTHRIEQAIGFHIRKTDNLTAKGRERNIEFQYDLFDHAARKTNKKIFLATDSMAVRNEFIQKYGERILYYETGFDPDQLRQTPLEAALMDLFILAHCAEFFGTRGDAGNLVSAFSRMAKYLGEARRNNFLPGFENTAKLRGNRFLSVLAKLCSGR